MSVLFFGIDIIDSEMTELIHKMKRKYGFRHLRSPAGAYLPSIHFTMPFPKTSRLLK
jgi:hypothetical protein